MGKIRTRRTMRVLNDHKDFKGPWVLMVLISLMVLGAGQLGWGSEFRVQGSGISGLVSGLGFRGWGSEFRVHGLGCIVYGLGFSV